MFLIKGRNFGWKVEWERVDPMEENNMRTITSDGNTQQQTKSKVNYLKARSFIPFILQISVPPRQSKFVLSILNFLKLCNCCILNEFVNYFPDLYISSLTVIILLSSKLVRRELLFQQYLLRTIYS